MGDEEGMGIFRQDGDHFERVCDEMGVTLTATDCFLFAPGEVVAEPNNADEDEDDEE